MLQSLSSGGHLPFLNQNWTDISHPLLQKQNYSCRVTSSVRTYGLVTFKMNMHRGTRFKILICTTRIFVLPVSLLQFQAPRQEMKSGKITYDDTAIWLINNINTALMDSFSFCKRTQHAEAQWEIHHIEWNAILSLLGSRKICTAFNVRNYRYTYVKASGTTV